MSPKTVELSFHKKERIIRRAGRQRTVQTCPKQKQDKTKGRFITSHLVLKPQGLPFPILLFHFSKQEKNRIVTFSPVLPPDIRIHFVVGLVFQSHR